MEQYGRYYKERMIMRKIILCSICVVFVFCSAVDAGSIWGKRDKNHRHQFTDDVARKIGDILTVTISESTSIDNETSRDMTKSSSRSTTFDGQVGSLADLGEFGITAESENEFAGSSEYEATRSFVDSITVVVIDILPNGNLVIMGSRSRKIEGDVQTIDVSGIVRPSDIGFNNVVTSEKVADFRVFVKNAGVGESFTKPGFLADFLNTIWPF